ncbi:transcriptional regulator family: Fungal Specific TF [Aspergillus niger]|nr:transcriptional regulator family: Fungal Specific TF [Aspergillus niger]
MTPSRKPRHRLIAGCQRCRSDTNSPACSHCRRAGVDCERGINVRFRNGLEILGNDDTLFPEKHLWPYLMGPLRFVDETVIIKRLYEVVESEHDGSTEQSRGVNDAPVTPIGTGQYQALEQYTPPLTGDNHPLQTLYHNGRSSELGLLMGNAFQHSDRNPGREVQTDSLVQEPRFSFNEREATLMRNYVENMALWADITDPHRHFEIEVPVRAMQDPVLRYAIFAFSSRHVERQRKGNEAEALQYHNHCLQLLIPTLSGTGGDLTDVVLATVAILRQHEEMEYDDNQFHLTGATRIINSVSSFGSSGGLGEAAAWLCLREDIHVSLISQKPLRTNLESFHHSDIFLRDDDFAWAARMVFLLAKVLKCAFNQVSSPEYTALQSIAQEVEDWYARKPSSFQPLRELPRGKDASCRFPEVWMLLPVHVVGTQYYHIAKIVLAFSCCPSPPLAYESFRNSRNIEKTIRYHLFMVLGLAKSNPKAENTLFTARHSLVAWGWVIRQKADQQAAEILLKEMWTRTGWDVAASIQSLREQWADEETDC